MTDFAPLLVADRGQQARPIHLVDKHSFADWVKRRPAEDRSLLEAQRFDGKTSQVFALLPRGAEFELVGAVADAKSLSPWCLAKLGEALPEGTYKLSSGEPGKAALGWLLAQHRFDTYRSKKEPVERGPRVLVTGEAATIESTVRLADATALVTPGAADHLVEQLKRPLGGARIAIAQAEIGIDDADQIEPREMMPLRHQLGADDDIDAALGYFVEFTTHGLDRGDQVAL